MNRRFSFGLGRAARVVVWAMAALVPMQALAGAVLAARGPLHQHRTPPAIVVLEDLRRTPGPARDAAVPRHVATGVGHFHASAPARHHHAAGDESVVTLDDAERAALDGEDLGAATLAAALALLPQQDARLHVAAIGHVRAAHAAWAPRTHTPLPFERPPRA